MHRNKLKIYKISPWWFTLLKTIPNWVVAETGKERAIVYENGPHVTTPEWMLLPMHKGGTFGKFSTSIGLGMYDRLAGVKSLNVKNVI